MTDSKPVKDQDRGKGAVEQDGPDQPDNTSLRGQLGHRDQDPRVKSSDTDFPEPGENPEHSGEAEDPKKRKLGGCGLELLAQLADTDGLTYRRLPPVARGAIPLTYASKNLKTVSGYR